MKTKRIDGLLFEKMILNGLANLQASQEEVNALNVFPVADGDTGTNMCKTLENGIRYAKARPEMGAYLKQLSDGMLLGARGNSGVILSQIFKGIFLELTHCGYVNPGELRNAFIRGYKVAYAAVVQPAEGTILTVAREGIEHIRQQIDRSTTVERLLSMYAAEMRKTLAYTPEMLPVLKEAGVVDSGALGFILIIEGMLKYLYGEVLTPNRSAEAKTLPEEEAPSLTLFNENSAFEEGYCMEFILQRLKSDRYTQRFSLDRYLEDLKLYGNSIAAVQDGRRIKVHIHTLRPAKVITLSQEYGEFLTFKLENMQLQHNEHMMRQAAAQGKHRPLAVVAVVNGTGMKELFAELGCDYVIDGGASMNTSSQEFIDVFRKVNAEHIVVLPNNKNIILAAQQAVTLFGADNITVLPTGSMVEGYFAIAMDVPNSTDIDFRLRQMREGGNSIETLFSTTASRDYSCHEISCRAGDQIALLNGELVCVSSDWLEVLLAGLEKIPDMEEKETCVIFRGAGISEEAQEQLSQTLTERYPMLELNFIDGGQSTYHWMLGVL